MSKNPEVDTVKDVLESFFEGLETGDTSTIRQIWHPNARLFLNSAILNTRSLAFLLSLPDAMDFRVRAVKHIDVQEVIATARVDYRLSVGVYSGFFHLVKANGAWRIANWVDHGVVKN